MAIIGILFCIIVGLILCFYGVTTFILGARFGYPGKGLGVSLLYLVPGLVMLYFGLRHINISIT